MLVQPMALERRELRVFFQYYWKNVTGFYVWNHSYLTTGFKALTITSHQTSRPPLSSPIEKRCVFALGRALAPLFFMGGGERRTV